MVKRVQVNVPEWVAGKLVGHETPPKWLKPQAEFFRSRSYFHVL
jgi:hypothetical protein